MDFLTASRQMLKDYCEQNGVTPDGDKRKADTWRQAAIDFFTSEQAVNAANKAIEIVAVTAKTTAKVAVKTFELATCPKAIELYSKTAYLAAMAVLLVICTVIAIGRMVIEDERTQAAIDAVKVKAAVFAEGARSRSMAWWAWVRSKFSNEYQNLLSRVSFAHLDLME